MIQLVSVPSEGSPVEKTSVFFTPTLQPPLLTVSSAQTELQYPFGVTLLCFAWLKKYHWLPASSALPRRRRKKKKICCQQSGPSHTHTPNSDADKNEYISLAWNQSDICMHIYTYHSVPMDRSDSYTL
jgi:hypothetical protein